MEFLYESIPRQGEVQVCFWNPTLTEDFCKIDRGLFEKKARRRQKKFGVPFPFFKNLSVFGKKFEKLTGFQRF